MSVFSFFLCFQPCERASGGLTRDATMTGMISCRAFLSLFSSDKFFASSRPSLPLLVSAFFFPTFQFSFLFFTCFAGRVVGAVVRDARRMANQGGFDPEQTNLSYLCSHRPKSHHQTTEEQTKEENEARRHPSLFNSLRSSSSPLQLVASHGKKNHLPISHTPLLSPSTYPPHPRASAAPRRPSSSARRSWPCSYPASADPRPPRSGPSCPPCQTRAWPCCPLAPSCWRRPCRAIS